jgi:hypothetical protein
VAIEMQKVESVKDQAYTARAISRGLGLCEVRKAVVANTAQFAVEISGLRPHGRERRKQAWIFGAPVEAGARQKLCLAAFNPSCHPKTIELDLVKPFRP